ncbi:MAG: aminotransferase class I/II-fold pyridoxal phosphate-dependent enzyme [Clostridiales bacterium]|nr:aminotransferase class I/II-fold pyridoxal phosphate-dependent enzyme [Clostridiales bacterium]
MGDKISESVKKLPSSGIRKFFDIVADRPDAISLGVGEPDFVTPWSIRDAAIKSVQKGYTQYTSNKGILQLREQIALYTEETFGIKYDPATDILVTVGASEAIDLAVRAICEAGDEILVPEPSYVSYTPCIRLAGGVPVSVPTTLGAGFRIMPGALEAAITPRTKALIFPYPNNPTGAIMSRRDIRAISDIIIGHDLVVISDEIYAELTYSGRHVSIASLPGLKERTVYVSGFSKAFAMTGWRLGYVAADKPMVDAMTKIHQYTIMCAPTASQYAALYALKSGRSDNFAAVKEMHESYDGRRKLMVNSFKSMGLECYEPKGAFYVFPSVKKLGLTGEEFATRLLKEENVAVVPGGAFGGYGEYNVRCCYATSMKNLIVALERIDRLVKRIKAL